MLPLLTSSKMKMIIYMTSIIISDPKSTKAKFSDLVRSKENWLDRTVGSAWNSYRFKIPVTFIAIYLLVNNVINDDLKELLLKRIYLEIKE